jgi:hypothetical protein
MRKRITENTDLLLLTGELGSNDLIKQYIRDSYESLIASTLAEYIECGGNINKTIS